MPPARPLRPCLRSSLASVLPKCQPPLPPPLPPQNVLTGVCVSGVVPVADGAGTLVATALRGHSRMLHGQARTGWFRAHNPWVAGSSPAGPTTPTLCLSVCYGVITTGLGDGLGDRSVEWCPLRGAAWPRSTLPRDIPERAFGAPRSASPDPLGPVHHCPIVRRMRSTRPKSTSRRLRNSAGMGACEPRTLAMPAPRNVRASPELPP